MTTGMVCVQVSAQFRDTLVRKVEDVGLTCMHQVSPPLPDNKQVSTAPG